MDTKKLAINKADPGAKLRHVHACLLEESQYKKTTGLEKIDLGHESAAGLNLASIDLSCQFLGHQLSAPLMIAPMTGGTELSAMLNRRWAEAAEHFGLAFGVGSQRLALENAQVRESFLVRKYAKSTMVFANLGAAQLLSSLKPIDALRAVEMIDADALFIHLNPLQEMCQEQGDKNFEGVLKALSAVVELFKSQGIPVLAREVGFGLSKKSAADLIATGIDGLDCAGAGGTSWSKVESLCAGNEKYRRLGEVFGEWGIPTAESIRNVRAVDAKIPLIATGGIRNGLDIAKALHLGADLVGMAQPMLRAAMAGSHALHDFIEQILLELRIAMAGAGKIRLH
jgi:isopentenyl-diphosphate delta-isomerase